MKKVKDFLNEKFVVVVGRGIKLSFIPAQMDKRFKKAFQELLEFDVHNTWRNPEGVVLYV